MVTLTILVLLGILYALVVFPWPLPLSYRLFLGLIITWPVLGLYGEISLPAGIPDLLYHRGYVGLLLLAALVSAVLTPRYVRSPEIAGGPMRRLHRPAEGYSKFKPRIPAELSVGRRYSISPTAIRGTPPSASTDAHPASRVPGWPEAYRDPPRMLPAAVGAYVLLKGAAALNGVITGGGDTTVISGYLDTTLIPVIMYLLTKKFLDSRRRLVWLLGAIILAAFIVCCTGLYERVLNLTASAFPIAPHNEAGDTRYMDVPGGRATGVIGSPAVFGGVLGLGLLTSLCCLVHATKTRTKILIGGVALVLLYGVFATYTRSVWISVSIVLLFAQFYYKGLWKLTAPIAVVGCLLLALMWSGLQRNELVQSRLLDSENLRGRYERFTWSAIQFLERPILGRGPGALDTMMRKAFPVDGFSTSHNTYMTILVDNGALVFAFFCVVVFRWLAKAMFVLGLRGNDQLERRAVVAMVCFLAIWLLCGMSLELRYFSYYTTLFWIAGAVIERLADACVLDNEEPTAGNLTCAGG